MENGWTVGQYFFHALSEDPTFCTKNKTFLRKSFEAEFDRIWETQRIFYPGKLTDEAYQLVRNEIIFYQRPLKSQKNLIGGCQFETRIFKDKEGNWKEQPVKVAPRSHPLFQEFKIRQQLANLIVSNIQLANEEGFNRMGERFLTAQERNEAFHFLNNCKRVKARKFIKNVLHLNPNDFHINYEELEGNDTRSKIISAFEREQYSPDPNLLTFEPEQPHEAQPYYRLWHLLYSIEDTEHLATKLEERFQLPPTVAGRLTEVHPLSDYGNLSAKAIMRLLPYLKKGLTYDKAQLAVAEAGGPASYRRHKLTLDDEKQRTLADTLSEVKRNTLRNPVVEQILNQVVNLVNAIISDPTLVTQEERQEGKFEIRVEMARGLKSNAKQRQATTKRIKKNRENNKEVAEKIKSTGISHPTFSDIVKYKLWVECDGTSPYTFKPIPLAKLFDQNNYEIEHIIPKSRFFDDSFLNKTICETSVNRDKGNMTAYEYMESKGSLAKFEKFVLGNKHFSKTKKKRLLDPKVPEDFVNRQLKETQYITKAICKKLLEICHRVTTTTGGITDYLRHDWGLNAVMQQLNWEKYKAVGLIEEVPDKETGALKERIKGWSKRDDHRHHAIDAIVTAFTRQSYIQRLNNLNQVFERQDKLRESGRRFPPPLDNFTRRVSEALGGVLISHRKTNRVVARRLHKHKVKGKETGKVQVTWTPRGALHEESVYGRIKVPQKGKQEFREEYVKRYPLDINFKPKKAESIVDEAVKRKIKERLASFGNDPKLAFKDLENNPIFIDTAGTITVKKVRCFTGLKKPVALHSLNGEPIDFVQTGKNNHMAIYQDGNGNRYQHTVSFWEAVERKRHGLEVVQPDREGCPLVATYAINDLFVVGLDPSEVDFLDPKNKSLISKHLFRIQKVYGDGKKIEVVFRHHLVTKNEKTNEEKAISKSIKKLIVIQSLKSLSGTRVFINRLGDIAGIGETLYKLK
ncbi:MAG: type II CRISPR RNA-guided endonuclease Cas9 [Saprospiraceae bacterium]